MAIIRCPECGHEISDKAPFCPSCGVAIAGKVTVCSHCGNSYFSEIGECPQCHHKNENKSEQEDNVLLNVQADASDSQKSSCIKDSAAEATCQDATEKSVEEIQDSKVEENQSSEQGSSRNNKIIIAVSIVIVAILAGLCYYFYHSTQLDKEAQAYNYAMNSNDQQVLQQYLDDYMDAPEAHIDSVQAHLAQLKQISQDWTNTLVSGSRTALQQYLEQHPDSPYKALAMHKLDSLDWNVAQQANTVEAIESYIEQHPEGEYIEDAQNAIKRINTKMLQPEEKQMVSSVLNSFFQCIENRNEDAVTSLVNPLMTNFLGKSSATRSDVITFIHKIYKSNVASMKWQVLGDYVVNKKELGGQDYEFVVAFSVLQSIILTDDTTDDIKYKINATVDKDGRISEFNMVKIIE